MCEGKDVLRRDRNVHVVRQPGILRTRAERTSKREPARGKPGSIGRRAGTDTRTLMGRRVGLGCRPVVLDMARRSMHPRHPTRAMMHARACMHAHQAVVHGTRMQRRRLRHQGGEPGHQNKGEDAIQPVPVHGLKLAGDPHARSARPNSCRVNRDTRGVIVVHAMTGHRAALTGSTGAATIRMNAYSYSAQADCGNVGHARGERSLRDPVRRRAQGAARGLRPAPAVLALAETFKALGDPTRPKIVLALSQEELCVCDLARLLGASQSAVSHSLRFLRQMQLVSFRKVGKCAYYVLEDEHIGRLLAEGFHHVTQRS